MTILEVVLNFIKNVIIVLLESGFRFFEALLTVFFIKRLGIGCYFLRNLTKNTFHSTALKNLDIKLKQRLSRKQ